MPAASAHRLLAASFAGLLAASLFFTGCDTPDAPARGLSSAGHDAPAAADTTQRPAPPEAAMLDSGAVKMPVARRRMLVHRDSLWQKALRIHFRAIVFDGHIDTPTKMIEDGYDFGRDHRIGEEHVDLPRMAEGGLDAAFFSIYVPSYYGEGARATRYVRTLVRETKRQVRANADRAGLATSAADVRRLTRSGKKAILMGLEGGHALARSADTLRAFARLGIRYVTLTHRGTHSWADAATDTARHGGLTEKGEELVRAMNDAGVLVDLSHVSDSTFYDALRVSRAPVILSHSSTRALTAHPRNANDAMLRTLAENGGVIMINFYDHYVRQRGAASVSDILDHIDHAVQVAGIDHVGLGSDFDGVPGLPQGMEDVTHLPWITYGLIERGYAETDVYKILGGNTLRVLAAAEKAARRSGAEAPLGSKR